MQGTSLVRDIDRRSAVEQFGTILYKSTSIIQFPINST